MYKSAVRRVNDARRSSFRLIDLQPPRTDFKAEVLKGLRAKPRSLPAKFFYDDTGSHLFEQITELPEYYLTRTEIGILEREAESMVDCFGEDFTLIEFGSGNSRKVRILLDAGLSAREYMPVDISESFLRDGAAEIYRQYPNLDVTAVCADYTTMSSLPLMSERGKRVVFFPGSTIGNLTNEEARAFLANTARLLVRGDAMLVGTDLRKDIAILHAAYNDSAGVTAEFNRNVLRRINRELGARIDVESFAHVAFFNEAESRIEMHLRSELAQRIEVAGEHFDFAAGETIHTENSYKYDLEEFRRLTEGTGFAVVRHWTDPESLFAVQLLEVV